MSPLSSPSSAIKLKVAFEFSKPWILTAAVPLGSVTVIPVESKVKIVFPALCSNNSPVPASLIMLLLPSCVMVKSSPDPKTAFALSLNSRALSD